MRAPASPVPFNSQRWGFDDRALKLGKAPLPFLMRCNLDLDSVLTMRVRRIFFFRVAVKEQERKTFLAFANLGYAGHSCPEYLLTKAVMKCKAGQCCSGMGWMQVHTSPIPRGFVAATQRCRFSVRKPAGSPVRAPANLESFFFSFCPGGKNGSFDGSPPNCSTAEWGRIFPLPHRQRTSVDNVSFIRF